MSAYIISERKLEDWENDLTSDLGDTSMLATQSLASKLKFDEVVRLDVSALHCSCLFSLFHQQF